MDNIKLQYLELFNNTLLKFLDEMEETYSFMKKDIKHVHKSLDKPGQIYKLIEKYYRQAKEVEDLLFNNDSSIFASKVKLDKLDLHYLINHKSLKESEKGLKVFWSYLHNLYIYSYVYHKGNMDGIIHQIQKAKTQQNELSNNNDLLSKISDSSELINSMFNSKGNLSDKESNFMSGLISQITSEVSESLKGKDMSKINVQNLLEVVNSKGSVNKTGIDFQGIMEKVAKNVDTSLKSNKEEINFAKIRDATQDSFGSLLNGGGLPQLDNFEVKRNGSTSLDLD